MSDLKACPFCAEPASMNVRSFAHVGERYGISCTVCECWCDFRARSPEIAAARWNTRLSEPSERAQLPQEGETPHD